MPRSRRGGPREGGPGKGYANRSDLNERRTLPASAAPGQTYGKAAAQVESQKQVPMASAPLPGSVTPLDAPTSRPGEPVTAGIPLGPGPGPEVLMAGQENPDMSELAPYLPALELLVSMPGASTSTRNLVRRIRAAVPPVKRGL